MYVHACIGGGWMENLVYTPHLQICMLHIHLPTSIVAGGGVAGTPENEVFSLHPLEPKGCKAVSPRSLAISVRVAKKNLPL